MTLQNRVECQLRTPCDPRTAREWGHCIVRHTHGKTPEQIAAETGIPLKRLMKISAPMGDTSPRLEEIAAVTKSTGRLDWLRFYARLAGCEVFAFLDSGPLSQESAALEQLAVSFRSLSALADTLASILRDRRIAIDEYRQLHDAAGAHVANVQQLLAWALDRTEPRVREMRRGA